MAKEKESESPYYMNNSLCTTLNLTEERTKSVPAPDNPLAYKQGRYPCLSCTMRYRLSQAGTGTICRFGPRNQPEYTRDNNQNQSCNTPFRLCQTEADTIFRFALHIQPAYWPDTVLSGTNHHRQTQMRTSYTLVMSNQIELLATRY